MLGSSRELTLAVGSVLVMTLCLLSSSTSAADQSEQEKLGRDSATLFFEKIVPLVDRGDKFDFMAELVPKGYQCRSKEKRQRVDCRINGRSRFIARLDADTVWAVLLISSQNGVCRGILSHAKQTLGEPGSTEDAWQEWPDEENERLTGFKEKSFCQLIHFQTGRDE